MTNDSVTVNVLIQIREEIGLVKARLENVLDAAGAAAREHEAWLRDHDVRISKLESHPRRRRPDRPPRRR